MRQPRFLALACPGFDPPRVDFLAFANGGETHPPSPRSADP